MRENHQKVKHPLNSPLRQKLGVRCNGCRQPTHAIFRRKVEKCPQLTQFLEIPPKTHMPAISVPNATLWCEFLTRGNPPNGKFGKKFGQFVRSSALVKNLHWKRKMAARSRKSVTCHHFNTPLDVQSAHGYHLALDYRQRRFAA